MNRQEFRAGESLSLTISFEEPRFGLLPDSLFQLAVRQNQNRAFLFVSRVLGKHLPIRPSALFAAGKLLASAYTGEGGTEYYADLVNGKADPPFCELWERLRQSRHTFEKEDQTLMIGFAETATGLARAAADGFDGAFAFLSTTRVCLPGAPTLSCDEAHSHARKHLLYLDPDDPFLKDLKQVMLVDDELTTGKTAAGLIRELFLAFGIRRYVMVTVLDWSGGETWQDLERELGVEIRVVSLLRGRIEAVRFDGAPPSGLANFTGKQGEPFSLLEPEGAQVLPGRLPLKSAALEAQRERCEALCGEVGEFEPERTLFLGTGEFIYPPALIAGLAGGRLYHSSTQSPVLEAEGSAIVSGVHFDPPDSYSPTGYLYNVPKDAYEEAVVFAERAYLREAGLRQLTAYLKAQGVGRVRVIAL